MIVAFAPADDRIATLESQSEGDGNIARSIRFAIWDIQAPQPDIETTRRESSVPLTPAIGPPTAEGNPLLRQPVPVAASFAAALWVGFDLNVRAMNTETGAITTILM